MKNKIIVSRHNRGIFGWLLDEQFRQRKQLFVDQLAWEIPTNEVFECDQYDRHDTVYVLVEEQGELVAFARLLPTNSFVQYGHEKCSYLVKDAVMGSLPGIPQEIYSEQLLPASPRVWEMTRVDAKNPSALFAMFDAANRYLVSQGAVETITFTRKSFARILTRLGYPTQIEGPCVDYGGKDYCVLKTELDQSAVSK